MIKGWVSGGQGCHRPCRGTWKGSPPIPWQGCLWPPFLGRERAAVNVDVGPERRSPLP